MSDLTHNVSPQTSSETSLSPLQGSSTPQIFFSSSRAVAQSSSADVIPPPLFGHIQASSPAREDLRNPNRSCLSHHDWSILKREDVRLRTFDDRFTASFLNPMTLAQAGFFYLGIADQVQCPFCKGVIGDWEINDDPSNEHQRLFPTCPFVLGLPVGNLPLGEEPPVHSFLERTGSLPHNPNVRFDIASRFSPQTRQNAAPDTEEESANNLQLNALIGDNLEELGITKHSAPRYSMYATKDARLKSFTHWPTHLKQTPIMMADAGFFYLGIHDHVKCFHCDGGLRNWEPNDDPWLEHAQWFPRCRYVILVKGDQYIKEAAAKMPPASVGSRFSRSHPPPSPLVSAPRPRPREVTEDELRTLLDSPIAQTVLNMGVDLSRVKQALQYKIRSTGHPFTTVDSLLEAAIEVQHYSEHRQAMENRNYATVSWPTVELESAASSDSSQESSSWEDEPIQDSTDDVAPLPSVASSSATAPPTQPEAATTAPPENQPPGVENQMELQEEVAANVEASSSSDRTHLLEEEIRRLKEARLCKVCLDEDVSVAYIPCGHIVTCVQCATALDQCPLCRKNIKGTVRIFFS